MMTSDSQPTEQHDDQQAPGRKAEISPGEDVLVDVAPFIASALPNGQSIPCEVLQVERERALIQTKAPFRIFQLWVERDWIEKSPETIETPDR